MNKVICEICGTQYPETGTQCPICGCAKPVDAKIVADDTAAKEKAAYTYVKGGRFSKANVRKRNKNAQSTRGRREDTPSPKKDNDNHDNSNGNRGLIIACVILLLAIIITCVYIAVRFFLPTQDPNPTEPTPTTTVAPAQPVQTTEPVETTVPCTSLTLETQIVELAAQGDSWLLNVTKDPADSTDEIIFISSDTAVATVSPEGRITAVAPGQTVITVICGDVAVECRVVCLFSPETTEPSQDDTETTAPVDPDFVLELNREDFTLGFVGDSWNIYDGDLDASLIIWTTDDAGVAIIDEGLVVAMGYGVTEVHGEYNGQKVTCIVRVG